MKYVTLNRQQLYDLVWSESFLNISKKYKIAYDGIRTICRNMDIVFPPTGYWGMKEDKKALYKEPLPEGYTGKDEVILYIREANEKENTGTPAKTILQEIYEDSRLNFGVPDRLSNPDPMIVAARESLTSREYHYPKCDGMFRTGYNELSIITTQKSISRCLRFFDTLIKLLKIRGYYIINENEQTYTVIYGEKIEMTLREKMKRVVVGEKYGYTRYQPTGVMSLEIKALFYERIWEDGKALIEMKMARILASIETGAKHAKEERDKIDKWHREREEKQQKEKQFQEHLEKEVADFKNLYAQAKRLQLTSFMREYIRAVEQNAITGGTLTDDLQKWLRWAEDKIRWYDPLINKEDKLLDYFDKDKVL